MSHMECFYSINNGLNDHNSEGEDSNYFRGRRVCKDIQNTQNRDNNSKDDLKIFTQVQLESIVNQREALIIEQYEDIIGILKDKLSELQDHLEKENSQNLIYQEQVIDFIKVAHTCPFNCFKGQQIKSIDYTPIFNSISTPININDLQDIQNRNRNLSTGTINFVKDKQLKTNLFLQKKLENAEKEMGKTKQAQQIKYDTLQQKYDNLQLKYDQLIDNEKQIFEKEEEKNEMETLLIKFIDLEEENRVIQLKYNKIKDLIKEKYNLVLTEEEDDDHNFSELMSNWQAIISRNKSEFFQITNEFEKLKYQTSLIQKTLNQKEIEQETLIQKIAQAEIQVNEYKQEINFLKQKQKINTEEQNSIEIQLGNLNQKEIFGKQQTIDQLNQFKQENEELILKLENNQEKVQEYDYENYYDVFEIEDLIKFKTEFQIFYKKLIEEKRYAEQTAIDAKVQLAEMSMTKDYYEHNFLKLLKKLSDDNQQ